MTQLIRRSGGAGNSLETRTQWKRTDFVSRTALNCEPRTNSTAGINDVRRKEKNMLCDTLFASPFEILVIKALDSPGEPLDAAIREYLERHIGTESSRL